MQPKAAPLKWQLQMREGAAIAGASVLSPRDPSQSWPCHVRGRICPPSSIPKPQLLRRICSQTSSVSKGWLVLG